MKMPHSSLDLTNATKESKHAHERHTKAMMKSTSRPHSSMGMGTSNMSYAFSNVEEGQAASHRNLEPDRSAPYAAPFRSSSASTLAQSKRINQRLARPKSTTSGGILYNPPMYQGDESIEGSMDAMLNLTAGQYHRLRTDITSARQTRAGAL
jgi:hypothetical protein